MFLPFQIFALKMTAISKFEADYNANLVKMQLTTDPTDWYNKTKRPRLRCHKFTFAEPPDPKKTSVIVTPGKSVVHEWLYGPATALWGIIGYYGN